MSTTELVRTMINGVVWRAMIADAGNNHIPRKRRIPVDLTSADSL